MKASNWTIEDKKNIMAVFTALAFSLKSYGNSDHKERLRSWELIIGSETTGDQVCAAMIAHAKQSSEIPTPAELLRIINPPPAKITYAEYKYACDQHKAEGFPMFGYYAQVIKDYEKQQGTENENPTYHQILQRREAETQELRKILGEALTKHQQIDEG